MYVVVVVTKPPFKWEDATTLDTGGWAYRRGIKSSDVKTAEEVIELLIKTVRYCSLRNRRIFSKFSGLFFSVDLFQRYYQFVTRK